MAPEIKTIPQKTWTLAAQNVTTVTLMNINTSFHYYWTYRDTGEAAPPAVPGHQLPREAVPLFSKNSSMKVIQNISAIDVYIWASPDDAKNTADAVLWVAEGLGESVATAPAAPYLNYDQDFKLKVNQGLIPGHSWLDKFGENPDVDTGSTPEDIWEQGGTYIYDADGTAPIVSLVSDNASDTQPISVTGLDINGDEVVQEITLTGTTRVALTTPLWRVYRMANEADSGNDLSGTVFCYIGTSNTPAANEIRASIDNGNNQTLMALYTIPNGKVGFLHRGEIGASRSQNTGSVQSAYFSRRLGKVFKIKKRVDTTNQGSSVYQDSRTAPDIVPGLTDIRLRVESVSSNNTGVFGTFDILLIDEDLFPTSYLTAIGQPGY